MKAKISILGCGPTGIQTAVYLLELYGGEVLLYDDDVDYAKGMALDCMQASAVRGWVGALKVVESVDGLKEASVLIVTEGVDKSLGKSWIQATQNAQFTIYASSDENGIEQALNAGVSKDSILGVHGLVDAKILAEVVSDELNVSVDDVQAMVFGGVGTKMESKPEFVRVNGISVDLISEGIFDRVLAMAKEKMPYTDEPWSPYYTLAAAAVEVALIMESGQSAILPITMKDGTVPALVGNYGIQQVYDNMIKG